MTKAQIRTQFLQKRKALGRSAYWNLNEQLLESFKQTDWSGYKNIHIFLPIRENNEPDTFAFIQYLTQEHPDIRIILPRTDFGGLSMKNILYDPDLSILQKNKYGIPEPVHGREIPSTEIDAVLLPLLAFDEQGNRVGYGKGFYDRFLQTCRPDVFKAGISLFGPSEGIEDVSEFDQPMDCCITPEKTWTFHK